MKLSIILYLHKILFVQYTSGVFQDMAENIKVYKKKEDLAKRGSFRLIRMMIDLIFAELTYLHGAEWPSLSMIHTSLSDRFIFKNVKKSKKE